MKSNPPKLSRLSLLALLAAAFGLVLAACGESVGPVDPLSADSLISLPSGPSGPPPAVEPEPGNPNHFFIGPAGDDSADGKTPESAWQSLRLAIEGAKPGNVFWVMDGVYDETYGGQAHYFIEASGTPDAWIRFRAMPGHRPKVQASTTSAFEVPGAFVEIQGFELEGIGFTTENSFGYGVVGAATHHLVIADNIIHGFPTGGFGSRGSSHLFIMNNEVFDNALWDSNQGSGISMWRLTDHGFDNDGAGYSNYIVGNTVYRNENRVFCGFCEADILTDGNGIIIDENTMNEAGDEVDYSGRTLIANNTVFDNGGRAINVFRSNRVDIFNNTAFQNLRTEDLDGSNAEVSTFETKDIAIANNLIAPRVDESAIRTNGKNQRRQSNLIIGDETGTSGNDFLATEAAFLNPSLDPAVADFRLRISSPAIGAAVQLLGHDSDGRERDERPDIGAYEGS